MGRLRWFGGLVLLLFLTAACILSQTVSVQAGAAKVSIRSSSEQIVKGDYFYVVITVSADEEIKEFEGYFTYDQSVLKYVTGGSVSSGNDDEIHIKDTDREDGATRIKYSVKFLARKTGECVVALKKPFHVSTTDDIKMSVGSASLELEVLSAKKAARLNRLQQGEDIASPDKSPQMPSESPEATPDASPTPDREGDTQINDIQSDFLDEIPEEQQEIPSPTTLPQETNTGLDRRTCIVIICLALTGIVMIGALTMGMWRGENGKNEEDWAEEILQEEERYAGHQESGEESGEEVTGSGTTEPDREDTDGQSADLEEIERRLEQKRQWLRKE